MSEALYLVVCQVSDWLVKLFFRSILALCESLNLNITDTNSCSAVKNNKKLKYLSWALYCQV